ncbi:MAG: T9SS type A sorting domain-containing protein [Chitinophagaceae bacterium]
MKIIFTNLLFVLPFAALSQARLIINGGIIFINNGAALVIDNPVNTAISQTGTGYIVSEGINNRVIWSVGAGNAATYLIPFGHASGYLPLRFSAASGSANGRIVFSTYRTPTWKNSEYLPPGITNINVNGSDNSAKLVDRFWQINALGYTIKPTLTNLSFTYLNAEHIAPNSITETKLVTQRWNNLFLTWSDYSPSSLINATTNTITIASIPGNQLYTWWTLADAGSPLRGVSGNLKAPPQNSGNESDVSLYPNPAAEYIIMAVSAGMADKRATAHIYDAKGSLVQSFIILTTPQQVNISSLAAGVYRIHFLANDRLQTLSFLKK